MKMFRRLRDNIKQKWKEAQERAIAERKAHEELLADILEKLGRLGLSTRREMDGIYEVILLVSFECVFGMVKGTKLYLMDKKGEQYEVPKEKIDDTEALLDAARVSRQTMYYIIKEKEKKRAY